MKVNFKMDELASHSYCLIEPKKEMLVDQDIEVSVDHKDLVIPKKEYTGLSDSPEDNQRFKVFKPIKTETILCKEVVGLQNNGVASVPNPNMSTGYLAMDIKLESGHGATPLAGYDQPNDKTADRKRGKVLHSDAREITYNVIKYFDEEKHMERYHPYQLSSARAAMATGLSAGTISKIKKEGTLAALSGSKITTPKKGKRGRNNTRVPIDNFDLSAIRRIISSIYDVQKEVPTLNKIIAAAKKDIQLNGSKTTLRRILKEKLGFTFKKCRQNRMVLIEKETIKAARVRYLRRIRRNDSLVAERRPVVYLDQSWIHANYDRGVRKNDSPGQRWVIVHAGSENGFIDGAILLLKAKSKTGDFHDEIDGNSFLKYLKEKLIPNLQPNSIVVVENAAYCSIQIEKAPTACTRKDDIIKWMEKNNYQFDRSLTKAEMLSEIKNRRTEKKYVADELLARNGHEVLRLPCNCGLNPIEYIWKLMKQRVAANVEQPESNIEILIREAIDSITPEDWKEQINNIKGVEERYWVQDVTKEDEFEEFIIELGMNSDSDGSSDDNDDMEDVEYISDDP